MPISSILTALFSQHYFPDPVEGTTLAIDKESPSAT